MPVFAYIAAASGASSPAGVTRGELTADSAYQVRLALRRMGLAPISVRVARTAIDAGAKAGGLRALVARSLAARRRAALAELYEGLSMLLVSGLALSASLELLGGGSGPTLLCKSLAERVRSGATLSDALAERADWFGVVDVALVRAAEQSGELEKALAGLAERHARSNELRGKLAGALAYPALLTIFGLGVVIFLTTTTLPQLAATLSDSNVSLPGPTKVLLSIGALHSARWWIAAPAFAALLAWIGWLARRDRIAKWWLRFPLIGRVIQRGQSAELSLLLSRLLDAGIPLGEALAIAGPTVGNAAMRAALAEMEAALRAGRSVADALRASGVFDPVFCRALEVGEESGELASTLRTLGTRFQSSTRRLIDRLASVLEPVVILVLAACIGFVVYAAIAPMLRLAQTISA